MNKIFIIASAIIFGACNTVSDENNNHKESHNQESVNTQSIELNNGEKWTINKEMKPPIQEGENFLKEYISSQDTTFTELSEQLSEYNSTLIKSCSMTGKAHDELHKWLVPHISLVDSLGKVHNQNQAENLIKEISESFNTFNKHFK